MRDLSSRSALLPIALLAVVTLLGLRLVDRELGFYDEAAYVDAGHALATGRGYVIPALPDEPPQAKYPPVLPIVLAATWRLVPAFPDSLVAMKVVVLATFVGALAIVWTWLRRNPAVDPLDAFAVTALLGCSPALLVFATLVTTDVPYTFLSMAAVLLYERDRGLRGLLAALAVAALATLTRTVGLFLFAAMALHCLTRGRLVHAIVAGVAAAVVVVPWMAWSGWASGFYGAYPPGVRENYVGYAGAIPWADALAQAPAVAALNLRLLLGAWGFVVLPWMPMKAAMLVVVVLVLAFVLRVRPRRPSVVFLYCAIYVASLLLIPYPDTLRYTFPILPFLLAWTIGGLRAVVRGRVATAVVAGIVVAAVATDVRQLARHHRDAETTRAFHEMTNWIAANVPPDAVLVGTWDPAYHLLTRRRSVRVHVNDTLAIYYARGTTTAFPDARALADAFQRMRACWFVREPMIGGAEAGYFARALDAVEATSPAPFEQVYASADGRFSVRRRRDCPPAGS